MKERYELPCNIAQSLNMIGDRWTLLIIHEIMAGSTTFNDMKKALQGISAKLLSQRLKELEQDGLIAAKLYSDHPPRYQYTLTQSGQDLQHVFNALIVWGRQHAKKCYKKLVHRPCGHEVRIAYYCEHCDEAVDDPAAVAISPGDPAADTSTTSP